MDSIPPIVWPRHIVGFDPETQPVLAVPELPKLASTTLQLPFIRKAFERKFQWQVEPVFTEYFDLDTSAHSDIRPAAVCIPLLERPGGLHVLFTRRSARLYNHAGQICFPGGRIELTEDYIQAALRETWEEVGVEPRFIELIGSHHKIETAKKFNVDAFFEDKHDNAVDIHEELQIPVLLFDTPYNRSPIPEGVIRVTNWQEADQWIKKLFPIEEKVN